MAYGYPNAVGIHICTDSPATTGISKCVWLNHGSATGLDQRPQGLSWSLVASIVYRLTCLDDSGEEIQMENHVSVAADAALDGWPTNEQFFTDYRIGRF